MKPLFAVDLTTDKKNEYVNGEEFIVQKPSSELSEAYDNSQDDLIEKVNETQLPLPLRIIKWILGFFALTGVGGIFRSLKSVSLAQAYHNAAFIFWIAGASVVGFVIICILENKKRREVGESDETKLVVSNAEIIEQNLKIELDVPETAKYVEIYSFCYKIKNEEIVITSKGLQMWEFLAVGIYAYNDDENLYLANFDGKYAFPLSSLKRIKTIKKTTAIPNWNKEQPINSAEFKQYKLTVNQYGIVFSKYYHILEFEKDGETYGIYYPCYENPVFEELTSLKAEEPVK